MRILIVEDEPSMRNALQKGLQKLGYLVDCAADGHAALDCYYAASYDAIILDLNLPGMDGLEVLRLIRQDSQMVKVLILSARNEIDDRILGLDEGANDYLGKPFAFRELEARLRALIRRSFSQGGARIHSGDVTLDTAAKRAFVGQEVIPLSRKEYGILEYLLHHRGTVIDVRTLIEQVWQEAPEAVLNSFKVHIVSLRKKLPSLPIINVRGRGYYVE